MSDKAQEKICSNCGDKNAVHEIDYTHVEAGRTEILCCKCYLEWGGGAFCRGNCIKEKEVLNV
jgi:hypothetical protein